MGLPGRNDLCHCGSGKKYKKCCLQKDEEKAQQERVGQQEPYSKKEFIPAYDLDALQGRKKTENMHVFHYN